MNNKMILSTDKKIILGQAMNLIFNKYGHDNFSNRVKELYILMTELQQEVIKLEADKQKTANNIFHEGRL